MKLSSITYQIDNLTKKTPSLLDISAYYAASDVSELGVYLLLIDSNIILLKSYQQLIVEFQHDH